jgi:hypothetical protein
MHLSFFKLEPVMSIVEHHSIQKQKERELALPLSLTSLDLDRPLTAAAGHLETSQGALEGSFGGQ